MVSSKVSLRKGHVTILLNKQVSQPVEDLESVILSGYHGDAAQVRGVDSRIRPHHLPTKKIRLFRRRPKSLPDKE